MTERVFTAVMLFYATGAALPFITGGVDQVSDQQIQPIDLGIKAVLYAVAWVFIVCHWRSIIRGLSNVRWIVVLLLIAIASIVWSQDLSLTLRGSVTLLTTTAFAVYFGIRYTLPQQLSLLALTCSIVVTLSYFLALLLPSYGIDQGVNFGDWQGAFIQKNGLAEAAVLAVFVFLFAGRVRPSLRCLGIAASFGLLILSGSATGMIVCSTIILTLPLYQLIRARCTVLILFGLFVGALVVGLALVLKGNPAEALQLVNRSPDLSGRLDLWEAVLLSISKRPWLGYGFNAFWQGMKGESAFVIDRTGWIAGYAHNGFLDVTLQLGVLGLVTFVLGYLVLWRRALMFLAKSTGPHPIWLSTFLVLMLLYNLTEGSILGPNIYWVVYISTAVGLLPVSSRHASTDRES